MSQDCTTCSEMNNNNNDHSQTDSLFDSILFKNLSHKDLKFKYDKFEVVKLEESREYLIDLGDSLVLRSLNKQDYERGYLQLLSQLTQVGNLSREQFEDRFEKMKSCVYTYFIVVIEDTSKQRIIGSATLVNEQKFIHKASSRGRIEDVVVNEEYRGKKLGKLLVELLTQISRLIGNYKVSLECKDHLREFYEQFGFVCESGQNYLCQRF